MEEELVNSADDLRRELDALVSRSTLNDMETETDAEECETTLNDKEAEARFIAWYDDICQERMTMLEAEENYKSKISELETAEEGFRTRIKELENSTMVLLKTFEEAQLEIKTLREKYEPNAGKDVYLESYKTVVKERDTLLKLESQNKNQIKELETEVKQLRNYIKDFNHLQHKDKRGNQVGKLVVVTGTERLQALERENINLKNKLDRLKRENNSLISKTKLAETKIKTDVTMTAKEEKSLKSPREKIEINKKRIATLLPRIENISSGIVSDTKRSRPVPNLHRSSQTPFLMFGLGYSDIYRKILLQRSKSIESTSLSSSQFDSIDK